MYGIRELWSHSDLKLALRKHNNNKLIQRTIWCNLVVHFNVVPREWTVSLYKCSFLNSQTKPNAYLCVCVCVCIVSYNLAILLTLPNNLATLPAKMWSQRYVVSLQPPEVGYGNRGGGMVEQWAAKPAQWLGSSGVHIFPTEGGLLKETS